MYPGRLIVRCYEWVTGLFHPDIYLSIDDYYHPDVCRRLSMESCRGIRLVVRQMKEADIDRIEQLRQDNSRWLAAWEVTAPRGYPVHILSVNELAWKNARDARHARAFSLVIDINGHLCGQIHISPIMREACQMAMLGYWMSEHWANCGIMTQALAMTIDMCMEELHLHRLEINICPENKRSLRVVHKLGLTYEGRKKGFLYINHMWHDHDCYALVREDWPSCGLVQTLKK